MYLLLSHSSVFPILQRYIKTTVKMVTKSFITKLTTCQQLFITPHLIYLPTNINSNCNIAYNKCNKWMKRNLIFFLGTPDLLLHIFVCTSATYFSYIYAYTWVWIGRDISLSISLSPSFLSCTKKQCHATKCIEKIWKNPSSSLYLLRWEPSRNFDRQRQCHHHMVNVTLSLCRY